MVDGFDKSTVSAHDHEPWFPTPASEMFEDTALHANGAIPEGWFNGEKPTDLSQLIRVGYDDDNLERLAKAAAFTAVEAIRPAYRDPFVTTAALEAARLALGLKQLPQTGTAND